MTGVVVEYLQTGCDDLQPLSLSGLEEPTTANVLERVFNSAADAISEPVPARCCFAAFIDGEDRYLFTSENGWQRIPHSVHAAWKQYP